MQLRKRL